MPTDRPAERHPTKGSAQVPFLSVVMPVHEGAKWIGHTLRSLASEPMDGVEILVIDSSTGGATREIVEQFGTTLPLSIVSRPDMLPWQCKTNYGVDQATAEHVCILHQDDLWLPGRLTAVRRWIGATPDAVLHLAPSRFIDRRGRPAGRWTCPLPAETPLQSTFVLERLMVQNFVSVPAPVFSRRAWRACGGMDDALWYTADWDLWAKLAATGPVVYHEDVTTAFRVHGSSLTVTGSRDRANFKAQMETVLERYLPVLPKQVRRRVEPAARASININTALADASAGDLAGLSRAAWKLVSLGLSGSRRYLRDSRLHERALSRLRARIAGAF